MTDPRTRDDGDDLLTTLSRLSAALQVDPPRADLAAAVHARIDSLPVPRPRSDLLRGAMHLGERLRRYRRPAVAVAIVLLLGVLAVTPAGARIAQWLGIGAVQVVQEAAPPAAGAADPASADGFVEVTLDQATARARFPLVVPGELGPPTSVLIGRGDDVVSMVWAGGDPTAPGPPVRLDQLGGRPDYAAVKKYAQDVEFRQVGGADAFWLREPHPLVYLDAVGARHTERSRIAGPTLIWLDGTVTLRLEGVQSLQRALQIARSVS